MKQKLYTTGLLTTAMVFLGGIFKINHLPGAGIMLTAGMLLLIFVFFPLHLVATTKLKGTGRILSFIS